MRVLLPNTLVMGLAQGLHLLQYTRAVLLLYLSVSPFVLVILGPHPRLYWFPKGQACMQLRVYLLLKPPTPCVHAWLLCCAGVCIICGRLVMTPHNTGSETHADSCAFLLCSCGLLNACFGFWRGAIARVKLYAGCCFISTVCRLLYVVGTGAF